MSLVAQELTIAAPAHVIYELFTDPAAFGEWMAADATLEPVPGGRVRWTHANGDTVSGHYVELVPHRRIVFTYGWERADVEIPTGSATVTITITPIDTDTTHLRLEHDGLHDRAGHAHTGGWHHYLSRLQRRAEGHPPGADTLAARRVPTPAEMGGR